MTVSVPELEMPPPRSRHLPPVSSVRRCHLEPPAATVKIRNSGVPGAALRATVRDEAPGPSG